jgi:hypothetical protein
MGELGKPLTPVDNPHGGRVNGDCCTRSSERNNKVFELVEIGRVEGGRGRVAVMVSIGARLLSRPELVLFPIGLASLSVPRRARPTTRLQVATDAPEPAQNYYSSTNLRFLSTNTGPDLLFLSTEIKMVVFQFVLHFFGRIAAYLQSKKPGGICSVPLNRVPIRTIKQTSLFIKQVELKNS